MTKRQDRLILRRAVVASPALDRLVLAHLGDQLRVEYADPGEAKIPLRLLRLLKRATQIIGAHQEPVEQAFVDELMSILPDLRGFAISLERDGSRAEDLVQEVVLRALAEHKRFERGTNLRAWLFTIAKNQFVTSIRRRAKEIEDENGSYAARLTEAPDQTDKVTHGELLRALKTLRPEEREVLLLVAVDGLSYDESAKRSKCAIGTIKSRVNRARKRLAEEMRLNEDDGVGWTRI